jgi:hypothetical protein
MPAAPCPGRGTARRLMSRGRLSRAKAAREASPLLARGHRTWRYGADRERIGGPFAGPRPRSTDSGKPTSEAFGAGAGRGRHGKPHRMRLKRLPGRGETPQGPLPSRPPEAPEGASGTTPKAREEPGNSRPPRSSRKGTPQARTGAPLPRRERTAPPSRRTRRRAGLPNPSSRRRNEARAASRHRRAAIPVTGPPLSGSPFAAWTTPTEPGARGPMPGERFTPVDEPALSRDK